MTSSVKEKIVRELARLRMQQQDGDPATLPHKTELAHDEINRLLDELYPKHGRRVIRVTTSQ